MSVFRVSDFDTEVQKGNIPGHTYWNMLGEREGMETPETGEDLWRGEADIIPDPALTGEQMTVVSTDDLDVYGGIGINEIMVHYIDANGDEQDEVVIMDGTTGVNTVATDIRHINSIHTHKIGTHGVSVGNVSIYKLSDPSTVYNYIQKGGNKDLTCKYMVPAGHKLLIKGWHAEVSSNDRLSMRLRSTDHHGVLHEGIYIFKDVAYLAKTTEPLILRVTIPSLSKVKISAFPDQPGGEASVGCYGILAKDGY